MPKIVDHDERRDELLKAATKLIARVGLDEASNRAIAAETGWSTGTLAHYFSDKNDLVEQTLAHVHERQLDRIGSLEGVSHRESLRRLIVLSLPMDKVRREEAIVEISFWARALHSGSLSQIQREGFAAWHALVEDVLRKARASGDLASNLSLPIAAGIVASFVDGLQLEAVLDRRRFGRKAIEERVDGLLSLLFR